MSKFGFDRKLAALDSVMYQAMRQLAYDTRDYFVKTFDAQAWGKEKWAKLKSRSEPPPILLVTGNLKQKTVDSIKKITSTRVEMVNTAMDDRGRQYSNYHNEGTDRMNARPIMKQNEELTEIQKNTLYKETGRIWDIK